MKHSTHLKHGALLLGILFSTLPFAQAETQSRTIIGEGDAIGFRGAAYTPADGVSQKTFVYKSTEQRELNMHFHFPADWKASDKRPVMVFFFGGGWKGGTTKQFIIQADYFASRGMVTARPEYRVTRQDGVTVDDCVEDARSAVRWVRESAAKLGIDPEKVISSGGSAGGHLAFCTSIEDGIDASGDKLEFSPIPQAMVLYNPALFYKDSSGMRERVEQGLIASIEKLSPLNHVSKATPPALIIFGTNDGLKRGAEEYMKLAKERGVQAELWLAPDQGHGFFNTGPWLGKSTAEVDRFLTALGYLD